MPAEPVAEHVRRRMSTTKRTGTQAEMLVRRELFAHGCRYRVNIRPVKDVPRTGDIVFPRRKLAVLIDGCFWHGCPEHFVVPKTRTQWWLEKIERNRQRDRETQDLWEQFGWSVQRFWEHEEPNDVVSKIMMRLSELDQATA